MSWSSFRPTNLHLSSSLGGVPETWIKEFAAADSFSNNLLLQSSGTDECYGISHRLIRPHDGTVLRSWVLQRPITEVRSTHAEYAAILETIVEEHGISHIYVSSLVGHSLDAFRLGVPSTNIYHDYFSYCPAFFITRDGICTSCSEDDLHACKKLTAGHRPKGSPQYYLKLRDSFFATNRETHIRHVSPSRELVRNLQRLDLRFNDIDFEIVEHGIPDRKHDFFGGASEGRRLQVGLFGMVGWNKGRVFLRRYFDILHAIVDLHLVGAKGEEGTEHAENWAAEFIHRYSVARLPAILDEQRLDLALFLPSVPESFSYALSQAQRFCIPPAARRLGTYAERIQDGTDGFLFDLDEEAVIRFLLWADRERDELRRISSHLRTKPVRTVEEAVCDYYRLRGDYPTLLDSSFEEVLAPALTDGNR